MSSINQSWFQERLRSLKMSQRTLAKKVGIDPAGMSYMLSGKRRMTMEEAREIAAHLMVNVTEVMRQAGIEVLDDVRKVPITGYIGARSLVTLLPNGTHDTIIAPADTPGGSFALQVRVVNSPSDGWIYFIAGVHESPQECLDKLCLVALSDGTLIKGIVKKGYKKDLYNLVLVHESEQQVLENREIAWVTRVLWIQPN